jgi:hypothetical protein
MRPQLRYSDDLPQPIKMQFRLVDLVTALAIVSFLLGILVQTRLSGLILVWASAGISSVVFGICQRQSYWLCVGLIVLIPLGAGAPLWLPAIITEQKWLLS